MPTLILSFAPQTRDAAAADTAPRKNLRVLGSVTSKLLVWTIISGGPLPGAPIHRPHGEGMARPRARPRFQQCAEAYIGVRRPPTLFDRRKSNPVRRIIA